MNGGGSLSYFGYDHENVQPEASSVVESLRSIGYNLETAISDIIDNSIAADASKIKLTFHWNEENNYIRIEDNGRGMDEGELTQAMKFGSKSPLETRDPKDLGRFGMGLKTAAFSQARRLTVKTKRKSGNDYVRCWDLDIINETGKWTLLKKAYNEISLSSLGNLSEETHGTIVLLENLDRVVGDHYTPKGYNAFLSKVNALEKHLSMVFHRFLKGKNSIAIIINGRPIEPWDPYLLDVDATQELIDEPFMDGNQKIKISAFVLPHHSKITKHQYDYGEGPKGWNAQQGFYIYRNKRLLVAGTWLNLFRKEEPYKLARIIIDITSESDFNWQIDIKKSTARPPQELLPEIKRIGLLTRNASYKTFYHRGTKVIGERNNQMKYKNAHLWEQIYKHGKSFYKINKSHPMLLKLFEDLSIDERLLNSYLSLIEENAPVNLMAYNPTTESTNENTTSELTKDQKNNLLNGLKDLIYAMRLLNYTDDQILYQLNNIEPYKHHPELVSLSLEGYYE
jgi:anti-sigma regulatory factor (Ser/Thr protein kinase)